MRKASSTMDYVDTDIRNSDRVSNLLCVLGVHITFYFNYCVSLCVFLSIQLAGRKESSEGRGVNSPKALLTCMLNYANGGFVNNDFQSPSLTQETPDLLGGRLALFWSWVAH